MKIATKSIPDKSTQKVVVAVCSDPGSGRAILPVVSELFNRDVSLKVIASGPSLDIFNERSHQFEIYEVADGICTPDAGKIISDLAAGLVLTGAGTYNQIEHVFRLAARENDIRTVSIIDYWGDYKDRFGRMANGVWTSSRPDCVCCIDSQSCNQLINEVGFKFNQIHVTGPPGIEKAMYTLQGLTRHTERFRRQFDIEDDETTVVFFSEPFWVKPDGKVESGEGAMVDKGGEPRFGYTPDRILSSVAHSLAIFGERSGSRIKLIVKPHPREYYEKLLPVIKRMRRKNIQIVLHPEANPYELIALSDMVIGMSTVAVLEAALIGKISVSVQIGFLDRQDPETDPNMGNRLQCSYPVYKEVDLDRLMDRFMRKRLKVRSNVTNIRNAYTGSTNRAADVLTGLLRNSARLRSTTALEVR